MHVVYVLRSEIDKDLYIGQTVDIKARLRLHNTRKLRATKHRVPLELIYTEEFPTQSKARWRERYLKSASGHLFLKKVLNNQKGSIPSGPPALRAVGRLSTS